MVRFERYKVMKQSGSYGFGELSRMIDFSNPVKLTELEYQYHLGRLAQVKSDFLISPKTKQIYTIGGNSGDGRKMWKIIGRPLKVHGVYL